MAHSFARPRKSVILTILMAGLVTYSLFPLWWLLMSATKPQDLLGDSFGLLPAGEFALFANITEVLTHQDGIFVRWFGNTVVYVLAGAGGATLFAALGGYGLAKYRFRGRNAVFATVLGAVAVPGAALAVPTFLMFSELGLTNTMWSVILPTMVSPFGLYLMWVFASEAIPTELLEAARVDGAGEWRTFFTISLRLLAPGIVTVALFVIVATWNNYFLPLIMLSDKNLFPLAIGLASWNADATGVGATPVFHLVITGAVLTILPIVAVFLLLQRYWQSGLSAGGVKG
jgi:multiple sugar transport system permease protein